MRRAILAAGGHVVCGAYDNGAHPRALPMLTADRVANGEAYPGEIVVRLPRRFSRMHHYEVARELGRGVPASW